MGPGIRRPRLPVSQPATAHSLSPPAPALPRATESDPMKTDSFSTRLKALLEHKRLTLADVARGVGISAPSVHRWTRGGEIDYENLRALAGFLDVNWIWLRYGDEAIQGLQESMSSNGALIDERRRYLAEIMASEARLNLAHDMARIVTWEWHVLTDELTAWPRGDHVFGRPIEEMRSSLLPFRSLDLAALREQFPSGAPSREWDVHLPATDGADERWFASRGRLLFDAQERPSKVVGVSIDMTHRKQMERALERSEHMLRKVIETIPVGLFVADRDGRITTMNPEAERIWGGIKMVGLEHYGEYKGRWADTDKEVGRDGWTLARAIQKGEVSRGEIVHIEAFDGQRRTIIMSAIPLLDAHDGIIGAIEVNEDITALQQAEASRRVTVEQWNAIFEQALVGIAYEKSAAQGLHVNARFVQLLGSTAEALAPHDFTALLDARTRRAFERRLREAPAGEPVAFESRGTLRLGGAAVDVQLHVIRYASPDSAFRTLAFVTEAPSTAAD